MGMFFVCVMAILTYLGTALILGAKKADNLPGGAIAVAVFTSLQGSCQTPWYLLIIAGIIGHVLCVYMHKTLS